MWLQIEKTLELESYIFEALNFGFVKPVISKKATKIDEIFTVALTLKVHIFWEGHKILQNLHGRFDLYYIGQIYGGDFEKFRGLLKIYEHNVKSTLKISSIFVACLENMNFNNLKSLSTLQKRRGKVHII